MPRIADCTGLERVALSLLSPLRDGRLPAPWPARSSSTAIFRPRSSPPSSSSLPARWRSCRRARRRPRASAPTSAPARPPSTSTGWRPRRWPATASPTAAAPPPPCSPSAPPKPSSPTASTPPPPPARPAPSPSRRRRSRRSSTTGGGDVFVAAHLAARTDGLDGDAALAAALDAATRHISREILTAVKRYLVEKSRGLCQQMTMPHPIDLLVLEILSESVYTNLENSDPSKGAFFEPDHGRFLKKKHDIHQEYGAFSSWKRFQKETFGFTKMINSS